MTKSTITDERITSVIERMEHFASNLKWTDVRGAQDLLTAADGLRELQERRKADREPTMYVMGMGRALDAETASTCKGAVDSWVAEWNQSRLPGQAEYKTVPLYRHAQPAPVITFYRDGIEAAAKWIDQQREAYDSEHGWSDPDTGAFEFGNDAQRDYSSTLEELAEGIRALHPNAGNSPVIPDGYVIVPKVPTAEMQSAGASAIRIETTALNKLWTGNAVFRAMLAAAPQEVK